MRLNDLYLYTYALPWASDWRRHWEQLNTILLLLWCLKLEHFINSRILLTHLFRLEIEIFNNRPNSKTDVYLNAYALENHKVHNFIAEWYGQQRRRCAIVIKHYVAA